MVSPLSDDELSSHDLEKAFAEMKEFKSNMKYFERHYAELTRKFPDEWVTVYTLRNKKYVDHDKDFDQLCGRLHERGCKLFRIERTYFKEEPPHIVLAIA